jgi:hypothetical protein
VAGGLGESFKGLPAIRLFPKEWLAAFDGYGIQFDEIREVCRDVVFVLAHEAARPAGGDPQAPIREVAAYLIVWPGETITLVTAYEDIDEARAAAERLTEERG